MKKLQPVHLADLLHMTQALHPALWSAAAATFGYEHVPVPKAPVVAAEHPDREPLGREPAAVRSATAEPPSAEARAQPLFWRVTSDLTDPARIEIPQWLEEAGRDPGPTGCFESDGHYVLPQPAPLLPPARLARFLHQQLALPRPGADVDLPWLVRRLARGEPVATLRRQPRRRWPVALHLVVQNHSALRPLQSDLFSVARQVQRVLGSRTTLLHAAAGPQPLVDTQGRPAIVKPDGAPVLVLGDAGEYQAAGEARSAWQAWAARLHRGGSRPLLLAPLPLRRLHAGTAAAFSVALLDESPRLRLVSAAYARADAHDAAQAGEGGSAVQALSGLLGGLAAVDPMLLRHVRRALRHARVAGADVAAEVEWRHLPSVTCNEVFARVWPAFEGEAIIALHRVVPPQALPKLLSQMQRWVRALSPLLQAERLQTLRRHLPELPALLAQAGDAALLEAAEEDASRLWPWLAEALHNKRHEAELGLAAYTVALGRHNPGLIGGGPPALQAAWALANPRLLERADPAAIPQGVDLGDLGWLMKPGPAPQALVCEARGETARLCVVPEAKAGPGVLLRGLPGLSMFSVGPLAAASVPTRHERSERAFECSATEDWQLHIGARRIELDALPLPAWAEAMWREGPALFAALPGGRRLRWVPRCRFDVETPNSGAAHFDLLHGAWWDDAEYTAFAGSARRLQRPAWANAGHGTDDFGYWAAFSIHGVTQTMRFVQPGAFMMGSPENEEGRFEDERQHLVHMTRGYWIADTACTQALFKAVTGENPSRFNDAAENPVEQVSLLAIRQRFLPMAEEAAPGIGIRLPSETEWEYAARNAGHAMGSFNWGEGISTDQANFDGNYPLLPGGSKGEYRGRTLPVKHFEPSRLGLWQMAGNIFEWVADVYNEYPEDVVFDPAEPGTPGAAGPRVMRGGSWDGFALYCRSARRGGFGPDGRDDDLGFRLARGLLTGGGRAEPAGTGGAGAGVGEPQARGSSAGAPEPAARERGRGAKTAQHKKVTR